MLVTLIFQYVDSKLAFHSAHFTPEDAKDFLTSAYGNLTENMKNVYTDGTNTYHVFETPIRGNRSPV